MSERVKVAAKALRDVDQLIGESWRSAEPYEVEARKVLVIIDALRAFDDARAQKDAAEEKMPDPSRAPADTSAETVAKLASREESVAKARADLFGREPSEADVVLAREFIVMRDADRKWRDSVARAERSARENKFKCECNRLFKKRRSLKDHMFETGCQTYDLLPTHELYGQAHDDSHDT